MKALLILAVALAVVGCGSKSVTIRTPGSVTLPPTTGPVCILNQPGGILLEIPNQLVGEIRMRKESDRQGDVYDLFAEEVRRAGGNVATVTIIVEQRGHGHGYYIDPKLRLDCAAAGGQLR